MQLGMRLGMQKTIKKRCYKLGVGTEKKLKNAQKTIYNWGVMTHFMSYKNMLKTCKTIV